MHEQTHIISLDYWVYIVFQICKLMYLHVIDFLSDSHPNIGRPSITKFIFKFLWQSYLYQTCEIRDHLFLLYVYVHKT